MKQFVFVAALVLVLCAPMGVQAQSTPSRSFVTVDPISTLSVVPGHTTPFSFTFHVQPGYHINSSQPTMPELIPTSLGFTPPLDMVIARVQYPAGQLVSFPFDPTQKLSVYSGDVIIKAVLIPQKNASAGVYTVHGELKYQACDNNSCYPPKKLPIEFTVKVAKAGGIPDRKKR